MWWFDKTWPPKRVALLGGGVDLFKNVWSCTTEMGFEVSYIEVMPSVSSHFLLPLD